MWIEGNYRRNLMDMHIDDWNEEFLTKINCEEYVEALKDAGVQAAMVKAKPHTGLCYYPTSIGRMHKGLHGKDFLGEMIQRCHEAGIAVEVYFTQVFDNWAYENHPEWRTVGPDGKNFREYRNGGNFKTGRYGIVCPNNEGYREYVKENLQELNRNYQFEGMFLDMTFWPDICYCPSCRKKYLEETGRELPRTLRWDRKEFREFVYLREKWMADYAKFATAAIKEINPEVTVEHQFSMITSPWINASSELLMEAVDYAGGDYYGGFLQQSFINKYYKNVSPALPFIYHTSRCDPELVFHTTTKTKEELLLHVMTALVHNGAFLLVDAINPDGSIVPEVYHGLMKEVYSITRRYESYVSGAFNHNAAIWFASHAKYDPDENGVDTCDKSFDRKIYMDAPVAASSILRSTNLPYEVIGSRNLEGERAEVIILSNVAAIREEEMDALEAYVKRGGNLYVSGPVGNPRLEKLLGVKVLGKTGHQFTYLSPTKEGEEIFEKFSRKVPLTIPMAQYEIEIVDENEITVLATQTLPYTMTGTEEFAAIHSNPPGIYTDQPGVIRKKAGPSTLIWSAAPIELSKPYWSRQVFYNIIRSLCGKLVFESNAPKYVEVINWNKEGRNYFALLNQQEEAPIVPVYDIYVEVEGAGKTAKELVSGKVLKTEILGDRTRILIDKLELFMLFEVE